MMRSSGARCEQALAQRRWGDSPEVQNMQCGSCRLPCLLPPTRAWQQCMKRRNGEAGYGSFSSCLPLPRPPFTAGAGGGAANCPNACEMFHPLLLELGLVGGKRRQARACLCRVAVRRQARTLQAPCLSASIVRSPGWTGG